jgi:hypothetical protein
MSTQILPPKAEQLKRSAEIKNLKEGDYSYTVGAITTFCLEVNQAAIAAEIDQITNCFLTLMQWPCNR